MSNNRGRPSAIDAASSSIVVNAPVADVYARWLAVEEYPKFVTAIKSARRINRYQFAVCLGLSGHQQKAILEIIMRIPERRVAWRTMSNGGNGEHFAAAAISFAPVAGDSTAVDLKLTSSLGGAVARRVGIYLRNFKTLVECNGINTRKQPNGLRTGKSAHLSAL